MRITPELWQGIKERERGLIDPGETDTLVMSLDCGPGQDVGPLRDKLAKVGGWLEGETRRGRIVAQVPALAAMEVCGWPEVVGADLAEARPGGPAKPWFLAGALALVVALVAVIVALIYEPPAQQPQAKPAPKEATQQAIPEPAPEQPALADVPAGRLYAAGAAALKRGDRERAARLWSRLLELQPGRIGLRLSLGKLLVEMGRPNEARAQYEYILERDAGNQGALVGLKELESRNQ